MAKQGWAPYCGPALSPVDLPGHWNFDALVGLLAVSAVALFVIMRRQAGFSPSRYASAMVVLFIVFVSPLCALTSSLFSARVVHHLLVVLVAAPLLVASMPKAAAVGGGVLSWTAAQAMVLWFWHAPAAYEAAIANGAVYALMQLSLAGVAVGFWNSIRRAPLPAAVSGLTLAMLPMGLLGAVLTFSPIALYAPHFLTTAPWGMSPIEDQQLGGLIMWAPAAGVYLAAALAIFSRTLRPEVRQS